MHNEIFLETMRVNARRAFTSVKWVVFAVITGLTVGLAGSLFAMGLSFVNIIRAQNPWMIWLLPVAGLAIVALYHVFNNEGDTGTNLVISAVHSGDHLPFRQAPLIFISTLLTHLCGGSAGREGAALQLGGSIGNAMGGLFRFDEKDRHIMIMAGMSGSFAALFGTPMAAAIFSMEMVSVGVMHYSALVPCVISALTGAGVAKFFGLSGEAFAIPTFPAFRIKSAVLICILAILAALMSIVFCVVLHQAEHLYKRYLKNPYIRAFVGGCFVLIATLIVGNQMYNGAGMNIVDECIEGSMVPEAFLVKLLFTALTIGAGFKGGEIVPAFTVGAAFGCLYGTIVGFHPGLCAAVGMIALFCGVTNCPITSLLIAFELFGYDAMPYFLLTIAFSYMFSGYFGLYHSQKIVYSKYKTNYINRHTV